VAPFVPRGKTAPVAAFRLLEVAPDAAGLTRRLETPLLGRTGELEVLNRLLDRAAGGAAGELVTVLGHAGVGKTRLLRAFAERARERALVLTGSCPAYGGSAAGEVVGQLVAQARRAGDGTAPEVPVDAADPRSLFGGVRRRLEALAATRPVVVLLDDVHRADQDLLDLVEYLHAFAGAGLLLVVAARPEPPAGGPGWNLRAAGTVLELEPLGEAEAAELAAGLLGPDRAADGTARQVAAWAEGNPLFVEQLVRDLADREDPGPPGRGGSWPVPPAVEALVAVELDRLSADERAVLELASVVGRVFDWGSVAALAPAPLAPRVGGVLLALARRNLLRVAGREHGEDAFAFRHRLLRDAAYQAIPKRERAILHVRAADRVQGEAADLHLGKAYRYLAQLAGDEPPAPVVRRLRSAAG
jgi:predicted ATPase